VARYGRTDTVHIAEVVCLWYGAFGKRTGRLIAVRDTVGDTRRQLLLFTTNRTATAEQIVARYARWSIEVAIETAKGPMGVGQARNRVQAAVQRTVPLRDAHHEPGLLLVRPLRPPPRRRHQPAHPAPWYTTKTEPSVEDMLAKLRRTIIAAHFSLNTQASPVPSKSMPSTGPGPQQPRSREAENHRRDQRIAMSYSEPDWAGLLDFLTDSSGLSGDGVLPRQAHLVPDGPAAGR
jgi:hypothetical protein